MVVLNELDRYHLALAAIKHVPILAEGRLAEGGLAERAKNLAVELHGKLAEHKAYVREHGEDMPEIQEWNWPENSATKAGD
jgi:xylulose-5-phosphate/fructose-6-phosphate phosphoketolase